MTNVILCGGVGSRLWPLSRTRLPKQFARILPGESLFERTVRRNLPLASKLIVASNRDQFFLASQQLSEMGISEWGAMIEPVGRNTAPAIALACMMLDEGEIALVTPSDHIISRQAEYEKAVARAMALAEEGFLVTFGIKPAYPETGFGYIEADGEKVLSFKEKPDAETAKRYVRAGNYYWNSGMLCFKAGRYLEECKAHAPLVYEAARQAFERAESKRPLQVAQADMEAIPSVSVDYAVMEKSSRVACVAYDIGWSDLGSYDAVYELLFPVEGNALFCDIEPVCVNSNRNLVLDSGRQVALVDVDDLIVVESPDALLIAKRGSSQKVKDVVDTLKKRASELIEIFPRVERPWGNNTVLCEGKGYKVKRIEIRPGQRLSLHRHLNREEHWTVAQGEALIQIDDARAPFAKGQSAFAPKASLHRLENSGTETLVIVETQLGESLSEDDIERARE